jgi:hypothetical protein
MGTEQFTITVPEMTSPALYSLASVVTVTSHAALFGSAGIRISASYWSSTCAMTAGAPASCSAAGGATCVGAEAFPVADKASGGSAVSIDARDGQCGRVPFRGRGRHSSYDATSEATKKKKKKKLFRTERVRVET